MFQERDVCLISSPNSVIIITLIELVNQMFRNDGDSNDYNEDNNVFSIKCVVTSRALGQQGSDLDGTSIKFPD